MSTRALALVALGAHAAVAFQPLGLSLRSPSAHCLPLQAQARLRSTRVVASLRIRMQAQPPVHDFPQVPWADLSADGDAARDGDSGMVDAIMDGTKTLVLMAEANMADTLDMVQPVADTMADGLESMAETIDNIGEYTPDPSKKDSRLALLGVAALSGSGYAAVRVLGDSLDSSSILAIRFVIAALVLSPWIRKLDKEILGVALETGGWLTIGYVAQAVCLQTSSAGAAAFLASLTTVVCPVIERLTGKRLDKKAWTAMVLAVMGAFALEFGGGEMPKSNDLIGLLQPILFGIYLFKTEKALDKFPDQGLPITAVQTAVCAAGSVGWWGFWQTHGVSPASTTEILAQAAPAMDAASAIMRPAIDLLAQTQSSDDAALILSAIKNAPSAVPTMVDHAQSAPIVMSDEVMRTVDAMMQPVAEATNSIEAVSGTVADGVMESKIEIPDGVSNALWQAKVWAYAPKVFALAWLGVLSSAAVLAVESIAVGKLSSSETAVVFSTEPLWAAAVGAVCVGEHIGTNTFVGGALVVAACISRVASPAELSAMTKTAMADANAKIVAYKLTQK